MLGFLLFFVLTAYAAMFFQATQPGEIPSKALASMTVWFGLVAAYYWKYFRGRSGWTGFGLGLIVGFFATVALTAVQSYLTHGASDVERTMAQDHSLDAMRSDDPATYSALVKNIQHRMLKGESFRGALTTDVKRLMSERFRYASDAAVIQFYRAQLQTARAALDVSPSACIAYVTGKLSANQGLKRRVLSNSLTDEMGRAVIAVVVTGSPARRRKEKIDDGTLVALAYRRLSTKWGKDAKLLNDLGNRSIDARKGCAVAIDFMGDVLAFPTERAASAIRFFHTRSTTHP